MRDPEPAYTIRTMSRTAVALAYGLLVLCLVLVSESRLTGDAIEYLALTDRVLALQPFTFDAQEAVQAGLRYPQLDGPDGRQVLWHFWMLSVAASPFVALARLFGMGDVAGYAALNITMLVVGCWVCMRSVPKTWVLVAFLGPILWWADKAQVEVFTFTLTAVGSVFLVSKPGLAALLFGFAATQNPPFGALVVIAWFFLWRRRDSLRTSDVLLASAGLGLAVLHPAYYWFVIGRATPLVNEGDLRLPALEYLFLPIFDSNLGMLVNAPFALAFVVIGVVVARQQRKALFVLSVMTFLLFSFTQNPNVNTGGTPGMTRYVLWLIPLVLIAFVGAKESMMRRWAIGLAAASLAWSLAFYRPSVPQNYLEPTATALWLWTHWPDFENPPPEVFAERLRGREDVHTLAATPDCGKALLTSGQWPHPCPPQEVPPECREKGVICYANRTDGYIFRRVARRPGVRITLF